MSYPIASFDLRQARTPLRPIAIVAASAAILVAALALLAGALIAPTYRASVQIEFVELPGAVRLSDAARDARIDSIVATAGSTATVELLLRPLSLMGDPGLRNEAHARFGQMGPRAIALVLIDHIRAEREGATNLIRIEVEGQEPEWAARVADGVARALIARSLADRIATVAAPRATAIDLADRRRQADQADADLAAFRAGVDTVDDGQEIASLRGALSLAQGESAVARVRAAAAGQAIVAPGGPAANGINSLAELRAAQARAQRQVALLEERYDQGYPLLVSARTELGSANNAVAAEIASLRRSADADARGASARAVALSGGLATAEARRAAAILDTATLARLQRAADEAHEAYRQLIASSVRSTTDRALAMPELRLVAPATAPLRPISPDRLLLALAGALAGGTAGLAIALWWSRMRSPHAPIAI